MTRSLWKWVLGLGLLGLFTHALLSIDWAQADPYGRLTEKVAHESAAGHGAAPPSVAPGEPLTLEGAEIPCFGCHSYERYQTETRFNHPKHAGAGHCHGCHAFEGHFQVTIRQEHCDVCHKAEGQATPLREGDQPF
ncbi:MAG: hypothetical protein H6702_18245 [Myxococcales bacterium]|nr:hypothetical protein [Myxococcales bacterium]